MRKWAAPLLIFLVGEALALFLFLFLPGVDTAVSGLATESATTGADVWGWTWLMSNGVVRALFITFYQLILFAVVGITIAKQR